MLLLLVLKVVVPLVQSTENWIYSTPINGIFNSRHMRWWHTHTQAQWEREKKPASNEVNAFLVMWIDFRSCNHLYVAGKNENLSYFKRMKAANGKIYQFKYLASVSSETTAHEFHLLAALIQKINIFSYNFWICFWLWALWLHVCVCVKNVDNQPCEN